MCASGGRASHQRNAGKVASARARSRAWLVFARIERVSLKKSGRCLFSGRSESSPIEKIARHVYVTRVALADWPGRAAPRDCGARRRAGRACVRGWGEGRGDHSRMPRRTVVVALGLALQCLCVGRRRCGLDDDSAAGAGPRLQREPMRSPGRAASARPWPARDRASSSRWDSRGRASPGARTSTSRPR